MKSSQELSLIYKMSHIIHCIKQIRRIQKEIEKYASEGTRFVPLEIENSIIKKYFKKRGFKLIGLRDGSLTCTRFFIDLKN